MRFVLGTMILLIAVTLVTGCRSSALVDPNGNTAPAIQNDWLMPDHDAQHSNRATVAGPANPQLKWTYALEGAPVGVSAITDDGRFFATCGKMLIAFDTAGHKLWRAQANQAYETAPVLGPDGLVYNAPTGIYAYSPDGQLL